MSGVARKGGLLYHCLVHQPQYFCTKKTGKKTNAISAGFSAIWAQTQVSTSPKITRPVFFSKTHRFCPKCVSPFPHQFFAMIHSLLFSEKREKNLIRDKAVIGTTDSAILPHCGFAIFQGLDITLTCKGGNGFPIEEKKAKKRQNA